MQRVERDGFWAHRDQSNLGTLSSAVGLFDLSRAPWLALWLAILAIVDRVDGVAFDWQWCSTTYGSPNYSTLRPANKGTRIRKFRIGS